MHRTQAPSYHFEHNICETDLQPRFLYPSRVLLKSEPTTNGASSRARNGAYEELAGLVITEEGFDQASRGQAFI
jgi:hypothetical protein